MAKRIAKKEINYFEEKRMNAKECYLKSEEVCINNINILIKSAIEKGEFEIKYANNIANQLIKTLEEDGFILKKYNVKCELETTFEGYIISWDITKD